jgi:hypothetical protein
MESRFGNFDVGKEADFVVVDPSGTPALQAALSHGVRSSDVDLARDQTLFTLMMGIRESSIAEVYVQGRQVTRRVLCDTCHHTPEVQRCLCERWISTSATRKSDGRRISRSSVTF